MSFSKQACLIVGMGPGLALCLAQRFAAEGFSIGAISRSPMKTDVLASKLPNGTNVVIATADAADEKALQSGIHQCEATIGEASVLIYNVAHMLVKPLLDLEPDALQESLAANVIGALVSVQCVAANMISRREGTILFTGGGLALYPTPQLGALAVGKAGIRSFSLTLAKELSPDNVHVATVTICGTIQPSTFYAPEKIAEVYWQLHQDKPGEFRDEVVYQEGALG